MSNEKNKASVLLAKLANGRADREFSDALAECVASARITGKKAKLKLEIEVSPNEDKGAVVLRHLITTSAPKLPNPSTQMHIADDGELLTQLDYLMGGGPSEKKPEPVAHVAAVPQTVPMGAVASSQSGRLTVASRPIPAPLASAPVPAPVVGKDAAGPS